MWLKMSSLGGFWFFKHCPNLVARTNDIVNSQSQFNPVRTQTWQETPVALFHSLIPYTEEDHLENQPWQHSDGQHVLVADARLDNRDELLERFAIPLESARQTPDSYLILLAYLKWGTDCPHHLAGDFVFAIWDRVQKRLFCARDYATRPFFYHFRKGHYFLFATNFQSLLIHPEVKTDFNRGLLARQMMISLNHGEETFYSQIKQLKPAHWMSVHSGRIQQGCYWDLDSVPEIRFQKRDQYYDCFHEVFSRAIQTRLRSCTPVASHLSGGLDSTAVACLAASHLTKTKESAQVIHSFSMTPDPAYPIPERVESDQPYIQAALDLYPNIQPHYLSGTSKGLFDACGVFFSACRAPYLNPINQLWIMEYLQRVSQLGIRVGLSGQVGNITVSWPGNEVYLRCLVQGQWLRLAREWLKSNRLRQESLFKTMAKTTLIPLMNSLTNKLFGDSVIQYPNNQDFLSLIHPDAIQDFNLKQERREETNHTFLPDRLLYHLPRIRVLRVPGSFLATQYMGYRLHYKHDLRDPTLDRRVVEFCLGIPPEICLNQGQDRLLIRTGLRGVIPNVVANRYTRGAQGIHWKQQVHKEWSAIVSAVESYKQCGLAKSVINLDALTTWLHRWGSTPNPSRKQETLFNTVVLRAVIYGEFCRWWEEFHQ